MDIRTLIQIWSNKDYSNGFPTKIDLDENALVITKRLFDIHFNGVKMNGDSVMRLPRIEEAERRNDIIFTGIFYRLYKEGFLSPAYFLFAITEECINRNITDEDIIWGYMCRGLRTFASLLREIDLADKIKDRLPECRTEMNPELDVMSHIDILVNYKNQDYGIWSYQKTENGLKNGSEKLRGDRGKIKNGVYILCPFDENDKETCCGWWLHSANYVDKVVKIIKEYNHDKKCDNYNEITDFIEYMKSIHILKKEDKKENVHMTGNIGEWSELYTLFKLLADGKLYAADADTNKIPEIYYDVLKVIRSQSNGTLEYCRDAEIKVINAETGDVICSVPLSSFIEQTDKLLAGIKDKKGSKGAFELPEIWSFANSVKCQTLKAKSQDKADIHIMVHDIMSGRDDTFGFSIKSQLGSPSTLFNASGATNFTYRLVGHKLTEDEISTFHGYKYFKDKFDYLSSLGTSIEFVKTDNEILDFNLKMVMTEMPKIFAEMIYRYYKDKVYLISELTDIVADSDLIDTLENQILLRYKVKELLTNIALGMVPGTMWTGDYEATGGYIIVKDDGDIVCYHIYNHNAFKNYLFLNTRFDTPSKSKHGFGSVYEVDGEQYLKLNVQIRFVK